MDEKEYIEREAIRNELYEADAITMKGVKILNQFPAADVVEVVRCSECMMYEEDTSSYTKFCRREHNYLYATPDGGCTYGVRKDGVSDGK